MHFEVPGYDLGMCTLLQRLGPYDPTCRWNGKVFVKAFWTPQGPCTLALRQEGFRIESELVGPGQDWCRAWLPRMFDFSPQELGECSHAGLRRLARRLGHLKIGPVPWVFDVAVMYILQQRIAFRDAMSQFRQLVQRHGQAAPGPLPLKLVPSPGQLLSLGENRLQALGLDPKRARTLIRLAGLGLEFSLAQLSRVRGIGPWTSESVRGYAFGDPDAVPVGDLHLPHLVAGFLGGDARADDARMLELLESYRPVRFRVLNWIMHSAEHRAFAVLS